MNFKEKFFKLSLLIIAGFSVIAGYNFIRSISVPVFIENYGKDRMPEATMVMGVVLFFFMTLHGKLLSKLGTNLTCIFVHLLSALIFFSSYLLLKDGIKESSYVLFVAKDIYIVVLIEHYWSFFNSTFNSQTAKKLSGLFTGAVSIGPILSGYYVTYATPQLSDPLEWIWLTSATILPSMFAMILVYKFFPLTTTKEKQQVQSEQLFAVNNFSQYPQLKLLAWMVIITQFIAASTTFAFNSKVAEELIDVSLQTAYYGTFYSNINLIAGIIQFLFAPFLLQYVPAFFLFLFLAICNLGLNIFAGLDGSLFSFMLASLMFKSFDYSIFRCTKELFYVPLSLTARFHSKHLIDVFFYRASNSGVSTLFTVGKSIGYLKDMHYTIVAGIAASLWAIVLIGHKKKIPHEANHKLTT